jgi:hypothetical protein
MRWMSIILSIAILSLTAFAGQGAGSKLAYDPDRIQLAQAMTQPDTSPMPDSAMGMPTLNFSDGKLNPGKALLLSAIIPGAGQFYAKSPIFGGLFLALEIGAWAGVASYHSKGMKLDKDFHTWADQYWTYGSAGNYPQFTTYLGYEYWVATTYGTNSNPSTYFKGSDPAKDDIVEWMEKAWTTKQQHLPPGFTHDLNQNSEKDQQYYEMIGKYDQFWAGWPGVPPTGGNYDAFGNPVIPNGSNAQHWLWQPYTNPDGPWIHNSYRDHYQDLRKQSNDALDMSKNFTMAVMGNHVLSALHAGFMVSLHNRKLNKERKIEGALQFEPRKYNDEHLTMASLKVKF